MAAQQFREKQAVEEQKIHSGTSGISQGSLSLLTAILDLVTHFLVRAIWLPEVTLAGVAQEKGFHMQCNPTVCHGGLLPIFF